MIVKTFGISNPGVTSVKMPSQSRILGVTSAGTDVFIIAMVDESLPIIDRAILNVPTGVEIPHGWENAPFIGNIVLGVNRKTPQGMQSGFVTVSFFDGEDKPAILLAS